MKKKRLLLVDDEPRNLSVLEGHLAPLGHELVRATDGRTALALFAEKKPDLVLLDYVMPDFDGIDVLTHIRAGAGDHMPVVLVTAHADREHRLRGLAAGADEFLEKPIDGPILLTRVRTLLELKESRDAVRATNEALAARNDALERLQRQQRELMGFIIHDLKNPLAVVTLSLEWVSLNVPASEPALADAVLEAEHGTRRIRAMVEDLLLVSQLEESRFPMHPEAIDVGTLLEELLRGYRWFAARKRVGLTAPADDVLRVRGDRTLLRRVLENIIDNSLRYVPEDGRVAIATDAKHGEISVSNNGPKVPVADRKRIFEKFERGDGGAGAGGNAGLGLYFCKCALEALGGQIEVTETLEWPTSFVMRLPTA